MSKNDDFRKLCEERVREQRIKELLELLQAQTDIKTAIHIDKLIDNPLGYKSTIVITWVSDEEEWWIRGLRLDPVYGNLPISLRRGSSAQSAQPS